MAVRESLKKCGEKGNAIEREKESKGIKKRDVLTRFSKGRLKEEKGVTLSIVK